MLDSMLNVFFGCSHKRTTFPLTVANRVGFTANAERGNTYVACLDCGKEFNYNWSEMRIGSPLNASAPLVPVQAPLQGTLSHVRH